MSESFEERKEAGQSLFKEMVDKLDVAMGRFVSALSGFCNDAQKMNPDVPLKIDLERTSRAFITPALSEEEMFSAIAQTLVRASTILEGSVHVPAKLADSQLSAVAHELHIFHSNLAAVGKTANHLHELLSATAYRLYRFNSENREEFAMANIQFDEDALALSTTSARAIAERSVRLDIDVVTDLGTVQDRLALIAE